MKTRKEMIEELINDDMTSIQDGSMKDNDRFIYDVLMNGRKGYNNFTDEELQEEYGLYLMNNPKDEDEDEDDEE
jgi:hypothetical protein